MKHLKILILSLLIIPFATQAQEIDNELPVGMQENTDSLLRSWSMQQYLIVDNESQLADINPYFENAVYEDRLKRIPCVINMTYNDIVQGYIDRYTNRLRHSVAFMLGASNFYIPIIEEALAYYQVPIELKHLVVIESAYNPRARSRAGAVGLWQFMPRTATSYGLQINSLVDERCDPIKSSYAAAKLLKDMYSIFGDWTLVIAAYNCGPANVSKAIHRAGGDRDFWNIYQYLPHETRGYVPAFIAANYIMNYYGEHNIKPLQARIPAATDTLRLGKDVRMEHISSICGIDINEIKALNPQYLTNLIPGYRNTPCTLRLPQEQMLQFIDKEQAIYDYGNSAEGKKEIEETPITESNLLPLQATNSSTVAPSNNTYTSKSSKSSRSSKSKSSKSSRSHSVTVKSGQSLSVIAHKNGTTVAKLRKLNRNIKGDRIKPGDKIRVK